MDPVPVSNAPNKDDAPRSLQQMLDDAQTRYFREISEAWNAWQQRMIGLQLDINPLMQKAWRTLDTSEFRQAQTNVQRDAQDAASKLNDDVSAAYKKYADAIRTSFVREKLEALDPVALALFGQ